MPNAAAMIGAMAIKAASPVAPMMSRERLVCLATFRRETAKEGLRSSLGLVQVLDPAQEVGPGLLGDPLASRRGLKFEELLRPHGPIRPGHHHRGDPDVARRRPVERHDVGTLDLRIFERKRAAGATKDGYGRPGSPGGPELVVPGRLCGDVSRGDGERSAHIGARPGTEHVDEREARASRAQGPVARAPRAELRQAVDLPGPALEDTLAGLEEDVKDDTGVDVRYPMDVKGAEVLLVTPSADFFAEPHVESLIGYGKVFHAAGISWTLSSHASEAGNFGLFIGNYEQLRRIAMRIREAALELGVKRIIVGECGHAWRVAYSFWNTLAGIGAGAKDPFAVQLQSQLDMRYRQPMHICEFTWDLIQRGALTLDKEANDHRVVTFHDSCNVARASRMGDTPGGQFEIPRAIIRATVNRFHEMAPGTTHEQTFCCGGGGGVLTDELLDLRVKGALPRMESLDRVVKEHGVNFMATICAICKAQFTKVLPYYGFKMGMVGGVHQLVSTAIRLGAKS